MPRCQPITCGKASQANTEAVEEGMRYGEKKEVPCQVGFKAASSPVSFNKPCSTSVTAECKASGQVSFSEACVPVTCAPFVQTHESLRCTDPTCATLNEIVGEMVPSRQTAYGELVEKKCFPGYMLNPVPVNEDGHPAPSSSRCSATCQYTENHRQCVPAMCKGFTPLPNATVNARETTYMSRITVFICRLCHYSCL